MDETDVIITLDDENIYYYAYKKRNGFMSIEERTVFERSKSGLSQALSRRTLFFSKHKINEYCHRPDTAMGQSTDI